MRKVFLGGVHGLTLVTHNTADYQHVPGLRVEDRLAP